jgi:hypothetical protein
VLRSQDQKIPEITVIFAYEAHCVLRYRGLTADPPTEQRGQGDAMNFAFALPAKPLQGGGNAVLVGAIDLACQHVEDIRCHL